MRNRRIGVIAAALLLLVLAAHRPSADVRILDRAGDTPSRDRVEVKAAVDLGLVAVSVFWTWGSEHLGRAR